MVGIIIQLSITAYIQKTTSLQETKLNTLLKLLPQLTMIIIMGSSITATIKYYHIKKSKITIMIK